jgi:hypothetical protein
VHTALFVATGRSATVGPDATSERIGRTADNPVKLFTALITHTLSSDHVPQSRDANRISLQENEMSDMHLSDVTTLRARARQNVENGAVTESYSANLDEVLRLLNESLAT